MKKAWIKKTAVGIGLLIPVGLIIGFSNSWVSLPSISISGSSSMQPLFSSLGDNYTEADVTTVAGGSGAGVKAAALQEKDLGNSSANPYSRIKKATMDRQGYTEQIWHERNMKTVTVAWDAIAVVYKPYNTSDSLNLTEDNIANLYRVFAGKDDQGNDASYNVSDLIPGSSSSGEWIPYARGGGASASGTATSFLKESGFKNASTIASSISDALDNGRYGNDVVQTSESNIESWTRIKSDNRNGSIIYLSLGFVGQNLAEIESAGFKVATYNSFAASSENVGGTKYAWFSPLNTMFSTTLATPETLDFVWWFFDPNSSAARIISDMGFINLSLDRKATMLANEAAFTRDSFFQATDKMLEDRRVENAGKEFYGAIK